MSNFEMIGKFRIYFDQMYYLAYAGGKRELKKEDERNWKKTLCLPELLRVKEQLKLGRDKNPNVVPLSGRELLKFIKEFNFIPFFDKKFKETHILQLSDVIIYEAIKQKNYDIALRG